MRDLPAICLTALVIGAGCTSTGSRHPSLTAGSDRAADTLAKRADSLIARLLDARGEFWTDGSIYTFTTNQHLLGQLTALELHAVPSLIECMSDARASRVIVRERGNDYTYRALRGAVCLEALRNTQFFQAADEALLDRVKAEVGCADPRTTSEGTCDDFDGFMRNPHELKYEQKIWRAYLKAVIEKRQKDSVTEQRISLSIGRGQPTSDACACAARTALDSRRITSGRVLTKPIFPTSSPCSSRNSL